MKTLSLLVLFISATSQATQFDCINYANKEYRPYRLASTDVGILCNGAPTSVAPVICYREVIREFRSRLGVHNAAVLCSAAQVKGPEKDAFTPAKCYKKALRAMGGRYPEAAATICSRAEDYGPLRCAREIKDSTHLKLDWYGAAAICTQGFVASRSDNLAQQ